MASPRLEQLQTRYWQGLTTEAEEHELRMAAAEGLVAPELAAYLAYVAATQAEALGPDFDAGLMAQLAAADTPRPRRRRWPWASGIAAGLALLAGLGWALHRWQTPPPAPAAPPPPAMAHTPAVKAYDEMRKALLLMSRTLYDGMAQEGRLDEL